jgi:hypothetical protein
MDASMKDPEMSALTVKMVPKITLRRFAAACHMEGKHMNDVIRQFMQDYADGKIPRAKGSK